jgi:hypothetical protein
MLAFITVMCALFTVNYLLFIIHELLVHCSYEATDIIIYARNDDMQLNRRVPGNRELMRVV